MNLDNFLPLDKKIKLYENQIFWFLFVVISIFALIIRLKFFIYNPSLFKDEANLALNILSTDYSQLFLPLKRFQVSPPLFLIATKLLYNTFHPATAFLSDMVLRIVPFISGVIAIPAFGILLRKILKNKYIVLLGMLLLSYSQCAITMSAYLKQYSTEMLATILILLLTFYINLKEKSLIKMFVILLIYIIFPFLSFTSIFLIPLCFWYLIRRALKIHLAKSKIILLSFIPVIVIACFGVYIWGYNGNYKMMFQQWMHFIPIWKYVLTLFISAFFMFLLKTRKTFLCFIVVSVIAYLCSFNIYHSVDRLILFILPLIITGVLCPFLYVIRSFKVLRLFQLLFIIYTLLFLSAGAIKNYNPKVYKYKREYSRELWDDLSRSANKNSVLLFGLSKNTNLYYNKFYLKNNKHIDCKRNIEIFKNLKPGEYFYIVTSKRNYNRRYYSNLERQKVLGFAKKIDKNASISKNIYGVSYYVKFKK